MGRTTTQQTRAARPASRRGNMADEVMETERAYLLAGTAAPWYSGRSLTDEERARFRQISNDSRRAKARALAGECDKPRYPVPTPRLDTESLMPRLPQSGFRALSLFSGGGGLDIGFERTGFDHVASFDIMDHAGIVLKAARPAWNVFSGDAGDVTRIDWTQYLGQLNVIHGGPPCQPFSHAGRQKGASDSRDMLPELVRAVLGAKPDAFVCENVAGLGSKKFEAYLRETLFGPLGADYVITQFELNAADYGVPQRRRRLFFVGFRSVGASLAFSPPPATHDRDAGSGLALTMGARAALGLPDIGIDDVAPTLRSGLTGPRHTTSVVNSATSAKHWAQLGIWPNGVAMTREAASLFPAKEGAYRLSIPDCKILQGFPADWPISGPVYKALGLIGNSVAPPMGYAVAQAVRDALARKPWRATAEPRAEADLHGPRISASNPIDSLG